MNHLRLSIVLCAALTTAGSAWCQQTINGTLIGDGEVKHRSGDWVQLAAPNHAYGRAGAYGYDLADGQPYAFMLSDDYWVKQGPPGLVQVARPTGALSGSYIEPCNSQFVDASPHFVGALDDGLVISTPQGTSLWGCDSVLTPISTDVTDWIDIRSDEGVSVLEFGAAPTNPGLRLVRHNGGRVELGTVLIPAGSQWRIDDFSIRATSITVVLTESETNARRVDFFSQTTQGWVLDRTFTDAKLDGPIVGVGDARVVTRPPNVTNKFHIVRVDGPVPIVETIVELNYGGSYQDVTFAYARRGSLIVQVATGDQYGTHRTFVANRPEPTPQCPGNLNGDGVVDGADLGLLLGNWGPCSK